jgi:hypothetical protein
MSTDPETFYLSAADYRGKSLVSALVTPLTSEEVEELLLETMVLIDAYIGEGWSPSSENQEFIFPRYVDEDVNGTAEVPRSIALATRIIADAILEERQKGVLPHQVAGESSEGHSYQKHGRIIEPQQGFELFPPSAIALLTKYRRVGGQWAADN